MKAGAPVKQACEHCGTPFTPRAEERFCCSGCAYVAEILREGGLDRFYELKGDAVLPPVGGSVFAEESFEWLTDLVVRAESNAEGAIAETELSVQGVSCLGCVWLIDALFQERPGAVDADIDATAGGVRLRWERGAFDATAFARALARIGYRLGPPQAARQAAASTQIGRLVGVAGFLLLNTMLFTLPGYLGMAPDYFLTPLFNLLGAFFATLSVAVGGAYFFKRAVIALRRRCLHMDLPIALGLGAAYAGSMIGWLFGQASLIYFDFVATFTFLMLGGRWLQELALERSRAKITRRHDGPNAVTLIGGANDGVDAPAESITEGLEYAVAPGDVAPVASRLLDDAATVSLEWINGEAEPMTWPKSRVLPAGAVNVGVSALRLRAEEDWAGSLLAQLLKRPAESFRNARLERVLAVYLGLVIAVAFAGGIAWTLAGQPWTALQVAISVLVVSCPCALGVSLPLVDEIAAGALRRAGLFIKNTDVWERVRRVRCIVFDKTGTLTMETPRLLNPESLDGLSLEALNALHKLTSGNLHPVARALRESLLTKTPALIRVPANDASALHEIVGEGVWWRDGLGVCWSLGRRGGPRAAGHPAQAQAFLRREEEILAAFHFDQDLRDDAREICERFRRNGYRIAILSGDASNRVRAMSEQLGLEPRDARARCTPQDKANWIERHAKGRALMIGDGANDSLAFDAAICRGAPVVDRALLESTADFFFFGRSLSALPLLFRVTAARRRTVATIFALAVAYNIGAVALSLSGAMHPLLAAILMPLSSLATLAIAALGMPRNNDFQ